MKEKKEYGLNTILCGPPGTGKTYNAVRIAVSICDPNFDAEKKEYEKVLVKFREFKKAGRIEFTTFHQSYGYEEFIEGIKPIMASGTDNQTNDIKYRIESGVFKTFCEKAEKFSVEKIEKKDSNIWCLLLGGTGESEVKKHCFEKNEIRLRGSSKNSSPITEKCIEYFEKEMNIGDFVVIRKEENIIDAIGIVKSNCEYEYDNNILGGEWPIKRDVKWMVTGIYEDLYEFNGRENLDKNFVCQLESIKVDDIVKIANKNTPCVFIIDEINRGNISKIFGELITLIEKDKRAGESEEMETKLPYSKTTFSIPNNVYILGTMNTADRSIALMDTALRRRFDFIEMMPDSSVIKDIKVSDNNEELDVANMLDKINERIEYLYDREHTIGHAFFTRLRENNNMKCLADIFKENVIPLLQEYFYEDYEKIQLIMGDNNKSKDTYKFIRDEKIYEKTIFKGNPKLDLREKTYKIQREAFNNIQSYIEITKSCKAE